MHPGRELLGKTSGVASVSRLTDWCNCWAEIVSDSANWGGQKVYDWIRDSAKADSYKA
jgi:hypothetical protein